LGSFEAPLPHIQGLGIFDVKPFQVHQSHLSDRVGEIAAYDLVAILTDRTVLTPECIKKTGLSAADITGLSHRLPPLIFSSFVQKATLRVGRVAFL
jgi:hypothetical protein